MAEAKQSFRARKLARLGSEVEAALVRLIDGRTPNVMIGARNWKERQRLVDIADHLTSKRHLPVFIHTSGNVVSIERAEVRA